MFDSCILISYSHQVNIEIGNVYHYLGPLHPPKDEKKSFLQTYMVEGDGSNEYHRTPEIDELVKLIKDDIKTCNKFIKGTYFMKIYFLFNVLICFMNL